MPKQLAAADGSLSAIQMPLAGEKANAQSASTGAGLEELAIKPIVDRLQNTRTRLKAAEISVTDHEARLDRVNQVVPGIGFTRKRLASVWLIAHESLTTRSLLNGGLMSTNTGQTQIAFLPLDLPPLTTIARIGFTLKGYGYTALPSPKPKVELVSVDPSSWTLSVLHTTTDPTSSAGQFNIWHVADADDLSVEIDDTHLFGLRLVTGGPGTDGVQVDFGSVFVEVV